MRVKKKHILLFTAGIVFVSLFICRGSFGAGAGVKTPPEGISSQSFMGPVTKKTIRYNIYLPDGYNSSDKRYPVIYHLHGLGGSERSGNQVVVRGLEKAMAAGVIGPMIVVFPNGHRDTMWADSKDGAKPAETNVICELIPHIDSKYRTIATRQNRVIQGMSMGGYGAVAYATKFVDVFSVCVNYDGAVHNWKTLTSRRGRISKGIFENDKEYFDKYSPWYNAKAKAESIRDKVAFRMVVGSLREFNENYRRHLENLNIGVDYVQTSCGHNLGCLIEKAGLESFAFKAKHTGSGGRVSRAIEIESAKDLVYAKVGERELKLDVFWNKNAENAMPLIVCVHGGAWTSGNKNWCPALRMGKSGYVVSSINYRLSQHAPFPAQIHDCKAAIRWLRSNANKYSIDPERIGVWGASAGGHLVALLGTTAGSKELEGTVGGNLEQSSRVQAVCDFFGPTDLFDFYRDKANRHYDYTTMVVDRLLGGPIAENKELAESANPVNYVTGDDSPFLIMHGDKDDLVPMRHSDILDEALKKAGVETKLHIVKGAGHGFGGPEINKMVDEFFDRHLKVQKPIIQGGRARTRRSNQRRQQQSGRRRQMQLPEGAKVERDIVYARVGERKLLLDLYLPPKGPDLLPVIVWVHGGGWRGGSKGSGGRARGMLKKGYAVVDVGYRLSGEAIFPAQVEDCKAAVRWVRANAARYGLNPDRIGAWGSSAGGHLVAFLGTAGDVKEFDTNANAKYSSRVQAVCDWFGPTDFLQMDKHAPEGSRLVHDDPKSPESLLVGGPIQKEPYRSVAGKANPITYVTKDDPPFLIMHGDKDMLVPLHQSELLHKALKKVGVGATLCVVKGAGHGLGGGEVSSEELFEMATDFFDKHLKNHK
ncbi:MAG: alpha/beta hydrolase fold domain-containing protein [Phycisphaerae bacterium]|nr:alpha/beta hydrolase fold domain-containing protein [Phycisphaerae bacterium]NIP54400.1 alpha/beta hydrolase fold domain-containing protein [Phycisphaerae bacterium]NIS53259.1 alpha/beta hydrolase fold domain-containing protein [Phycisphaerae bacterium]NIU10785.1 alpha/beta hydrolase fold domain-containing protein [Phycisphaerae bacterium]NIU58580.1 alpha/beta hydrolase fold domain-containing protein [Phycisphaerae bacterium]